MNSKLNTHIGKINLSWKKCLWLYFMIIPTFFIDFTEFDFQDLMLNLTLLFITVGIGHSVGLHRGIIHKSYKASNLFRTISLYCFVFTGLGSPLTWLKQHYFRDYWQNRKDCPKYFQYKHSLITDYWWNLHLSFKPTNLERYQIPYEDINDSTILWLHKTWYIYYILFMMTLYFLLGFNSMLIATSLRTSVIILGHWYIGYASHKYGYARHKIENADESGHNDILLGLISFGEGFHNNHHSFPTSAKFSSKWYEIDFGWLLIILFSKAKLIYGVKTQQGNLKSTAKVLKKTMWTLPF